MCIGMSRFLIIRFEIGKYEWHKQTINKHFFNIDLNPSEVNINININIFEFNSNCMQCYTIHTKEIGIDLANDMELRLKGDKCVRRC
jgi:hypothetical protein